MDNNQRINSSLTVIQSKVNLSSCKTVGRLI